MKTKTKTEAQRGCITCLIMWRSSDSNQTAGSKAGLLTPGGRHLTLAREAPLLQDLRLFGGQERATEFFVHGGSQYGSAHSSARPSSLSQSRDPKNSLQRFPPVQA